MKKLDIGQAVSILANVGVIAGIIILAFELDQNSDLVAAQTRNTMSQSVIENIQMNMEPRVVLANLKLARGDALSAEDIYLLDHIANATFRLWENTHYQYRVGLLDAEELEADMEIWRRLMDEQAFADHWENSRDTYSRPFREVIDGLAEGRQ